MFLYYIMILSCPDSRLYETSIRGFVAAKSTSQELWRGCRQREDFTWTRSLPLSGRIRCCCEFVEDRERFDDKDDGLIVLAEWGTRKLLICMEPSGRSQDRCTCQGTATASRENILL